MAIAIWTSLRQLEAIRSSFFIALTRGAATPRSIMEFEEWAVREELDLDTLQSHEQFPQSEEDFNPAALMSLAWISGFMKYAGQREFSVATMEGTLTTKSINPETDYGVERSSASWQRWDNFLTTSAMLRIIATLEQYEIDTLKSLIHYRPGGLKESPEDGDVIEVEERVVHEKPITMNDRKFYSETPIWTWMGNHARRSNGDRRDILKRVFGIEFLEPDFGKTRQELYEMRNKIAHGSEGVDITLNELMQIHGYAIKVIVNIRDQVIERYKLIL